MRFFALCVVFAWVFASAFGLGCALDEFSLLGVGAGASTAWGAASAFANPAGAAEGDMLELRALYHSFWGISQYGAYSIAASFRTKYVSLGAFAHFFGNAELYSELGAGVVAASDIWRGLALGIRLRFEQVGFPEPYGKASTVLADAGLRKALGEKAAVGLFWNNVADLGKLVDCELEEAVTFGVSLRPAEWAYLFADVQFRKGGPGELYLGQIVRLSDWLALSGGVGGRPTKLYLGLRLAWRGAALAWEGTLHPELGTSYGGALSWSRR